MTHIIRSKAELTTTRIKRLLEVLCSYSFDFYYINIKDIILSDLLSRQKHDDNDLHEIILILFNMQNICYARYSNKHEEEQGKYSVQTRSQAMTSGTVLQMIQGIDKVTDPNVRLESKL